MSSGYLNFNGYLNFSGYLYGCGYLYGAGYVYGGAYLYGGQTGVFLQGAALQAQGKLMEAVEAYADDAGKAPNSPAMLFRDLAQHLHEELGKLKSPRRATRTDRKSAGRKRLGQPSLLISVPVWGKDYNDSLGNILLRTLLAPGNLPDVACRREIILELVTRESDADAIRALPALREIGSVAEVRIVCWPDRLFASHPQAPDFHYRLFGSMHHYSILRARAEGGMDVMPLCADHVFSRGALGQIDAYLGSGSKLVASAALRIDKRRWAPALLAELNGLPATRHLDFLPRRLVDDAIRYMHPVTRHLIVSKPFNSLPFPLLFAKPDGFAVHSFVLHPIAISADILRPENEYDFNTVDGTFLSRVMPYRNPKRHVTILGQNDEAYVFEASESGNLQETQLAPGFSAEMIARYFYDWRSGEIEALYKHMFRTPIRFYAAREKVTQEFHDIEENAVVAEIMGHIEGWEAERKKAARTAA